MLKDKNNFIAIPIAIIKNKFIYVKSQNEAFKHTYRYIKSSISICLKQAFLLKKKKKIGFLPKIQEKSNKTPTIMKSLNNNYSISILLSTYQSLKLKSKIYTFKP